MKVCPTMPASTLDRLVEGLWTPDVVPRIGYCEPSCTLCSELSDGAIWQITPADKAGCGCGGAKAADPAGHGFTIRALLLGRWPPTALCAKSGAGFSKAIYVQKRSCGPPGM